MFDWITDLIDKAGYAGIALMMFLENVFPPIPSWLVMPLAGFEASSGRFSLGRVVSGGHPSASPVVAGWVVAESSGSAVSVSRA